MVVVNVVAPQGLNQDKLKNKYGPFGRGNYLLPCLGAASRERRMCSMHACMHAVS